MFTNIIKVLGGVVISGGGLVAGTLGGVNAVANIAAKGPMGRTIGFTLLAGVGLAAGVMGSLLMTTATVDIIDPNAGKRKHKEQIRESTVTRTEVTEASA